MFRVLYYINEVYKQQSFSRAAEKLYLAQSSLSLTIKNFEREIGIQIFDRSTTPIQLTEAGQVYMEGIQQILSIHSDLEAYLDDYKELKTGGLTIGAPHLFSSYLLPTLIARFLHCFPLIQFKLVEGDFLSLHKMTLNGELDFLIESHKFDAALFQSYPLFSEQVLLAVPQSDAANAALQTYGLTMEDICADRHMDAAWPYISLQPFREHRFLLLEKGHDMYMRSLELCRDSGFEPQIFMTLNQLMTVYNVADQQLGCAFVTDTIVKLSNKGHNLTFYKISGNRAKRSINLAHKKNRYISRPMREFIKLMEEIGQGGANSVPHLHR